MAMRKSETVPTKLTLNGIKMLCESDKDIDGSVTLQVVEVRMFTAENARKNIKAKIVISDGVSRMICMISDKAYNALVST